MQTLATNRAILDRYNLSKLLQLMMTRKLAEAFSPTTGDSPPVIINALNPGLCRTQLFRYIPFPLSILTDSATALVGRDAEVGSRTLLAAAFAGQETHGKSMTDCRLHRWPGIMLGDEGEQLTQKVWEELLEILEGIEPGVTENIRG